VSPSAGGFFLKQSIGHAFGRVLRALRTEQGMSQEVLGLNASLQRKHISRLELGEMLPSLETVFKLANSLQIEPGALVSLVHNELQSTESSA
jgi:transcriptional regulator with XRE-family HTH domain